MNKSIDTVSNRLAGCNQICDDTVIDVQVTFMLTQVADVMTRHR
ncbi:MAG: hypothetical protein WDA26_07155 [Pusillimonas sp.]